MSEFFLELFSEEIPSRLQINARNELTQIFKKFFDDNEIIVKGKINTYSTPNRLIVHINKISKDVIKKAEEIRGPNINAPEKALEGFLKSNKINKEKVYTRIEDLLNDINIKKSKLVFSHNDLNANNILYNKDICIIDYEYSSLNNKFCDLSKVIFEFKMTEEEIESLLEGYRINFDDVTKKKIILWQRFNLYLDYIWSIIISSNENQLTKENIESFYLNKYIDFDLKN